ncbi:mucin-22 isoform X2 [Fopius arisanus]|uniref:Mucin-22 isoform X2 n=1 Tax=Fopius arisanus TaxID=64838 RepID=A0A9R1TCQ3_9HYME|nr:PREDICTED: mucin-22-like isoform X2 [Fopius arisanus]
MNLALHGFLLQVILSIIDFKYGLCSAGEPGYLDFDNLPETNFSCQGKVIGGYYADVEAGCQMFHVCTIGQKDEIMDIKFLCLNGTVFDQETRVCERVDEVDCSKSERFYNLNLELYGNNAVTLSLHEEVNDDEPPTLIDNLHQTTSARPVTTTMSTTTTPIPVLSSTTSASYPQHQHSSGGYPQHFQSQPPFPSVQTSQSKSRYDDKNGGYHRQYIYHNGGQDDEQNDGTTHDNQATSYQLFSNQGGSSTTPAPQIHQISTVSPLFHATSPTIQTLLTGNANNPSLINPLFHNHGIISTTEQFTVHSSNTRDTADYQRNNADISKTGGIERTFLEPIQSTNQGKVSKLTISPVPQDTSDKKPKIKTETQTNSQQHRVSESFVSIPPSDTGPPTVRSFYPTPKSKSETSTTRITQHIHLPPPPPIPQLKPHQVTIHLSPPEIQRLVQNPSPLLPSQSRVIVTAKASVSDESGRPLNTTQLVTLPLPTIPASYDDYKEGDESFDPFYRDVPKIRNSRKSGGRFGILVDHQRKKRQVDGDLEEKGEAQGDDIALDDEKLYEDYDEGTTIASVDSAESSNVTNEENRSDMQGKSDESSTLEEEYDEDYYDSQRPTEFNVIGRINDTGVESQEFSPDADYRYKDYSLASQGDDDKNSTSADYQDDSDYLTITEEPKTAVTMEDPTTTEQVEITTVSEANESNKTAEDTVLKFTQEIPQTEQEDIVEDPKVVLLDIPQDTSQDYVDDNYEPESYKEMVESETINPIDKENTTESVVEALIENVTETLIISTEIPETTVSENIGTTLPTTLSTPIDVITTSSSITTSATTMSSTTTSSTTPSSTTTAATTTSSTTISSTAIPTTTPITTSSSTTAAPITRRRYTTISTTTYRPTPPKLKNFSTRKTYVYSPPTTTPIPVIIKMRLPLLNPKPAKPPRSYNELAPKPVIRKRPLLARRVSTTQVVQQDIGEPEEITTTTTSTTSTTISDLNLKGTTEKTSDGLSEKLLERISEAVGQEIIEQINDLTTTTSHSKDFVDRAEESVTNSGPVETVLEPFYQEREESRNDVTTESTSESTDSNTTPIINLTTSLATVTSSQIASVLPVDRKPMVTYKRVNGFNCLEKEMYRFYADKRDCRLFHYCSPGFTDRQVLDFRFVCEEGTIFDEDTQSCLHDVKNAKCREKT